VDRKRLADCGIGLTEGLVLSRVLNTFVPLLDNSAAINIVEAISPRGKTASENNQFWGGNSPVLLDLYLDHSCQPARRFQSIAKMFVF
jgi:hypothetical protein